MPWLKKIIWVIGVLRRTVVSDINVSTTCAKAIFRVTCGVTWLWRRLPQRLSKRQSLTTVLLRTPITQIFVFNQGMLLLGSNHFLINVVSNITLFTVFLVWLLSFFLQRKRNLTSRFSILHTYRKGGISSQAKEWPKRSFVEILTIGNSKTRVSHTKWVMVYLLVNALVARELSGFICTSSLIINEKFQYRTRPPSAVLKILSSLLVNECR